MLKICTYFNAITALLAARFLSGLGVQGYPPPRNVDRIYISEYASSSASPCASSGRLLSGHPSSRRQPSALSLQSFPTQPRAARNLVSDLVKRIACAHARAASVALSAALSFSITLAIFIGAGLFATSAKALPEGLVYCHDDGNGRLTSSDLTATPPDAPTAICTERAQNVKNDLNLYYDEPYISDYSYLLGQEDGNSAGNPGAFADNIFPSFIDDTFTTEAQRQAMNGMARYLDYRRLDSTLQGAPYQNITYTQTGSLVDTLNAVNAQRMFYPYMSRTRLYFKFSGAGSSNNGASVTFDFETPITTDFIALHITAGSQQLPVTTNITATDVDGNTMQTAYSGPTQFEVLPIVDGKIEQPTPNWQRVQDAEVAHIATHLVWPRRTNLQAGVVAAVFPTMSLKTLTLSHSDLNQNNGGSFDFARGIYFIGIMKPLPNPYAYEVVFPLPEGCVVPTPA